MKLDTKMWRELGELIKRKGLLKLSVVQMTMVIRRETGCSLAEAHMIASMLSTIV